MSLAIKAIVAVAALSLGAAQPALAQKGQNRTILIVNAMSKPITRIDAQVDDPFYTDKDLTEGRPVLPGESVSIRLFPAGQAADARKVAFPSCQYQWLDATWDGKSKWADRPMWFDACKVSKITFDDTGFTVETGGPGKGPVKPRIRERYIREETILTEAEIAPCNELLSYRSATYKEDPTLSNLQFALSDPPYYPLYDLAGVRDGLKHNTAALAAVESGSADAQRKVFGVVFTGQQLVDRLMTHRRFQCMLNVRLRQLQRK